MSERDRGEFTPALGIFVAAAVFVFLWGVWDVASLTARETLQAEHHARQYAHETSDDIQRTCSGMNAPDMAECIQEVIETSHENQRAEYDLDAQNRMARWAGLLLITSAIGIGLLFLTFWETQKAAQAALVMAEQASEATTAAIRSADAANRAADDAKRIGEAQTRAYITVSEVVMSLNGNTPSLSITVHNTGQSPALRLQPEAAVEIILVNEKRQIGDLDGGRTGVVMGSMRPEETRHQVIDVGTTIIPDDALAPMQKGSTEITARVSAVYLDVFRRRNEETFDFLHIFPDGLRTVTAWGMSPKVAFLPREQKE